MNLQGRLDTGTARIMDVAVAEDGHTPVAVSQDAPPCETVVILDSTRRRWRLQKCLCQD